MSTPALSSLQLEAFSAVARTLHFSRAARQLHLTQSALSQRIKNLESELGLALFSRGTPGAGGVQLTEAGARLLRYCQTKDQLEAEILADLVAGAQGALAGVVRVAAYSSVLRSVVVPALTPLLREHPRVQAQFISRETRELPGLLARGEAEFVVLDRRVERAGTEARKLGEETYVLIESTRHRARDTVYLDHDPEDTVTHELLRAPGMIHRSYLGDIYGVIDGVAAGLGRAWAPRHLLAGTPGVRPVKGARPEKLPVVLHHHAQPVYPRLHQAVLGALTSGCARHLADR